MNTDCHLLILEQLDIDSLIAIGHANRHFSNLAAAVLRRRFNNKFIVFSISTSPDEQANQVSDTDGIIKIQNLGTMLKTLKYFGDFISKLEIVFDSIDPLENRVHQIYQFTNVYCSERLAQLHLANAPNGFFDNFRKPFKRLENVSLSGDFDKLSNENKNLSEIFIALRSLTLNTYSILDSNWIEQVYPHLEYLNLLVYKSNGNAPGRLTKSKIERLLENNKQIRILALEDASPELLRIVAKNLPNLEKLELKLFEAFDDEDEIHFKHLKFLNTKLSSHSVPTIIDLENLEELETDAFPGGCQRWMEFVEEHEHLKRLTVDHYYINDSEILRLAQANSNLTEMSLWCENDVKSKNLIKLIENNQHLRKMHLKLRSKGHPKLLGDALEGQLNDEWTLDS